MAVQRRAAGDAALDPPQGRQVGPTLPPQVEQPGRARAADFTEITVDGTTTGAEAAVGALVPLRLTGHDGRRAFGARA
jgi:hypothetical protein